MALGRKERETAIQILYQLEDGAGMLPEDSSPGIVNYFQNFEHDEAVRDESTLMVEGVCRRRAQLDEIIEKHSLRWRVARMAKVDRNILRLATYELMDRPDIPLKVVLNEAVELGKRFGSETSSAFINGILDPVARAVRTP